MDSIKYDICPNCNSEVEIDGVDIGIGYIYPPLHCENCGWSEKCDLFGTNNCTEICTEYEHCKTKSEN